LSGSSSWAPAAECFDQSRCGIRPQLAVLVQQQAELAPRLAQQQAVVLGLARPAIALDQAQRVAEFARPDRPLPGCIGRAVVGGVVEHEQLVAHSFGVRRADALQAGDQVVPAVGVDHAVGQLHGSILANARSDRRSALRADNPAS
jgi:hypothetical protein